MKQILTLAALSMTVLSAQAEVVEIRWSGEGRFEHQATVAPAKFVELCGKLPAGMRVSWGFEAGAPLDFNIHYHAGKKVVFDTRLKAVANSSDTLLSKLEQDYCWMWTNESTLATTLSVDLHRN